MLRLRSWMFVPGISEKMVMKALGLSIDVAMLDLEDGVVPEMKAAARPIVAKALQSSRTGGPVRYVRVNACNTKDLEKDLDAVVVPGLDGIVVPKIETIEEAQELNENLTRLEKERGLAIGSIKTMLAIETAKAIIAAPLLATATARVSGLMFGAEDFSKDIDLPTIRTGQARDFIYARSAIVVASAAARIQSVDAVWPDMQDIEGLRRDALLGRDLGFTGKSLIHPSQIEIINSSFSPSTREIAYAEELIHDFEKALVDGHGSISFHGTLVDRPIYERARSTVLAGQREMNSGNKPIIT
jgi:citrate lyase subunit beta/citryl-CoA lyase